MRKVITLLFFVLLLGVIITGTFYFFYKNKQEVLFPYDIPFKKEGSLDFYTKGHLHKIKRIIIELSETKTEISLGLMYRHKMDKYDGMFFYLSRYLKTFFWMKNTYIPLDIIYVDDTFHIVSIQKNTKPLLEKGLPSYEKTMYVLEVNAGFCYMHNIKVGDSISYKRI
ncbi:DUF192 domain-containing protein [Mariniflexile sp. HMF6888]|uniref:DUF192 domain-containing protein n=1 Tax=Mariniflexile sp. HMF6888 TaxID=3373086 RepID=UPI0037A85679